MQADQYGYGVHLSGTINKDVNEVMFRYTLTGHANDGTYRMLTGCEYDVETNMPTGMSYPETSNVGMIHATIDMEKGEIAFNPMAIWAAEYDTSTGNISVNENLLYEFVKTVNVNYDINNSDVSAIETPNIADTNKEVKQIKYYAIDGSKLKTPQYGSLVIKMTIYNDESRKTEKVIFKGYK